MLRTASKMCVSTPLDAPPPCQFEESVHDCAYCTVCLRPGPPTTRGFARLTITTKDQGECSGSPSLRSVLQKLLALSEDKDCKGVCVTIDLLEGTPDVHARLIRGLSKFWDASASQWSRCVPAFAILVRENIFTVVAQGVTLTNFLMACPLGASYVVCHTSPVGELFFEQAFGEEVVSTVPRRGGGVPFVTIVDTVDQPESDTTVASLIPFQSLREGRRPRRRSNDGRFVDTALCTLANGDIRVIQSAPSHYDLELLSPSSFDGNADEFLDDFSCIGRMQDEDVAGIKSLRFRCDQITLDWLIGGSLHVGEIAVDAEMLSEDMMAQRKWTIGSVETADTVSSVSSFTTAWHKSISEGLASCFDGICMPLLAPWFKQRRSSMADKF